MFKKTYFSVGLDIGTSVIKLIKIKCVKDSCQVVDFFMKPIEGNLLQALKLASEHQEIRLINVSLSGPSTIIRYVDFPKMAEEELKKSIKFEAQKFIPFPISEVALDVAILKRDLPDNKMLVSVAAVKKDYLTQRIKLLEANGFRLNIVDMDSLALVNAFNHNYAKASGQKQKAIALLNIGAAFSSLNILEDTVPLLSRDLTIAGNSFTQKIAEASSIDFKSAETMKVSPEKERLAKITQALEAGLANLATEIRVSFDYYESQSASSVSKIYLSGGSSLFAGLKDILANLLGIEVEYWDPFKEINVATNVNLEKLKSISSQMPVAMGLALRSVEK